MRVIFMGTPEFSVPALERLVLSGYDVVAVYTQPDKPAGRGRSISASPVKSVALALGLPVVQSAGLKSTAAVEQLAKYRPDAIVVAALGQILPRALLSIPPSGCVNIHPSLLPRYRGASPVASAILAGEEFTGVSIMLIDAGLDSGPVLAQAQIPIADQDTTGSLTTKLSVVAAQLLDETLVHWLGGELVPQPQNEDEATYCGLVSKQAGEIDWHLSAVEIWRRVRAFQPWPGAYAMWRGQQLKIVDAVPLSQSAAGEAGLVVTLPTATERSGVAFGVETSSGTLGVVRVQLQGKRIVSAAEFLRGQRQFIGTILPSG